MPAAIVGAPDLMAMFVHVKLVRKLCDCAFSFADRDSEEAKSVLQHQQFGQAGAQNQPTGKAVLRG